MGYRYEIIKLLVNNGISSALKLRDSNDNFIKQEKGIVVKKTIYELRKIRCYEIEKDISPKKSICVSRSFGTKFTNMRILKKL